MRTSIFLATLTLTFVNVIFIASSRPQPTKQNQLLIKNLIFPEYHVHIINELRNDILNVHCKSENDDLGFHTLAKGEAFEFHFRVDFFGATKFWCTFNWGANHGGEYRVFWYGIGLSHKCNFSDCTWFARDDAIYLKNKETNEDEKYYPWQS
ncbi:hypothetical protein JCGZ_00010 [Jatropha curcas]|uniref:S-protein homolog n=1 Tax=Jatropha curcas TaxID=180498 RepID=A0A067JJK8_JATCU|nr:hypothetical protein JCGZ_00010 [Jatropha curcas]